MGHHNPGGRTEVGTRAVVVRGGPDRGLERRTVVDEDARTVTVDDGTRFDRDSGLVWAPPGNDGPEAGHAPTRLVTEGNPEFEQLWAGAALSAFTSTDRAAWVEGVIAAGRLARRGDVHDHYDVAAIVDELAAVHPDLQTIPAELVWAVVDRHARPDDRDATP
ncbi:hypothetical protein ACH9EU_05800 [Kocuria sp. M1R5S2]|uniref:hypothetical protein n=1 Tax=Kocuria rhizosphaerae TaxID=3376285 RepID=UPI0037A8C17A